MPVDITIIKDSREQKGWEFEAEKKTNSMAKIEGTVVEALNAADYAIKGYEDLLRIERKAGMCELFNNMMPSHNNDRFIREMEKLKDIKHKYIIVEDNLSNDVLSLSVPQMYKGPPSNTILRWLLEIQIDYGVHTIFAGNAGKRVARNLFDLIVRKYL